MKGFRNYWNKFKNKTPIDSIKKPNLNISINIYSKRKYYIAEENDESILLIREREPFEFDGFYIRVYSNALIIIDEKDNLSLSEKTSIDCNHCSITLFNQSIARISDGIATAFDNSQVFLDRGFAFLYDNSHGIFRGTPTIEMRDNSTAKSFGALIDVFNKSTVECNLSTQIYVQKKFEGKLYLDDQTFIYGYKRKKMENDKLLESLEIKNSWRGRIFNGHGKEIIIESGIKERLLMNKGTKGE